MTLKKPVYKIHMPSTDFTTGAYWDGKGVMPAIRFTYKKEGIEVRSGLEFRNVLAMRERIERCCKQWHIEGSYDTLVEIENSPWVAEMREDTTKQWRDRWEMHHYMIYLDSPGCFEVIAESWASIPEEPVVACGLN